MLYIVQTHCPAHIHTEQIPQVLPQLNMILKNVIFTTYTVISIIV